MPGPRFWVRCSIIEPAWVLYGDLSFEKRMSRLMRIGEGVLESCGVTFDSEGSSA